MTPDKQLPAEALAAITGVQRLLDDPPRPVSAADGNKAAKLTARFMAEWKRFLTREAYDTADDDEAPAFDVMEVSERLQRPGDPSMRIPELTRLMTDADLGLSYAAVLDRGIAYLKANLPVRSVATFHGDRPVAPSRSETAVFRRQWAVANDPLIVFRDLQRGCLVTDQVNTFAEVYPELYAHAAGLFDVVIADVAVAKGETWDVPWRRQRVLEAFFRVSRVSPSLDREMQGRNEAARKPVPTRPLDIDGADFATNATRLATQ